MRKAMRALVATLLFLAIPSLARAQGAQLPSAEVCFQAAAGQSGLLVSLGAAPANQGSGGSPGTYTNVALVGGSGSGATANITIGTGGNVTQTIPQNPGMGYVVGDTVSAAPGGISGLSMTVTATSVFSGVAGGSVGFYVPGTLTSKQTWQDSAQTILNTDPVSLDANGCALIYGSGIYRQILKDSLGNTVWDHLTTGASTLWGGTSSGSANAQTVSSSLPASDGQTLSFAAGFTNAGALTITGSDGTTLGVQKDTPSGPVPLTGGEVAVGNVVTVAYSALGNFLHLVGYPTNIGAPVSIASAATTDIGPTGTHNASITGTTAITSFGSDASTAAPFYVISFTGSLTLTASSSLITPSGNNITTSAGDTAVALYQGGGIWKLITYSTSGVPSGAVQAFNAAACPSGWLAADGTNGTVDLRGVAVRGLDNGKGYDTGRTLASYQADQLQTFTVTTPVPISPTAVTLAGNGGFNAPQVASGSFPGTLSGANFGTETRMKNVALLYCQKL